MLKIYIGPNGYGKSYSINNEIEELKKEKKERKDILLLNSELVFADEMKDTVNNSFVMEYLIGDLLDNEELSNARLKYEKTLDKNINDNQKMYNDIMDEVLLLNNQERKKDVISPTKTKEYKKIVKINSDDLKNKMGSGQKLLFLLKLIQRSNKKYIFLDEPENHMHPSLLHVTAGLINEISKTKNICIATHSPELLNLLDIDFDNLFIFNDKKFGNPKKIDFNRAVSHSKNIHIENLNNKSKSYFNANSLKKNIIELHKKEFMNSLFSKKVYIVEGINDELFLKKLIFKYDRQYEQYSIFQCYGKPHFIPFINIFKELGIETIPLFDKDKEFDDNNIAINNEIKKCNLYLESIPYLEKEINYDGKKEDTTNFIDYLDNYNNYEKYKYILKDIEEDV
jgi:predicted ATPase